MKSELIQAVLESGLYEYGNESMPLSQKWAPYLSAEVQAEKLVIACNCSDYTFTALPLIAEETEHFAKGIATVCEAFGIQSVEVYLPKEWASHADEVASCCGMPDVTVSIGKVNVREITDTMLLHHVETIVNIGRVCEGLQPEIRVVVRQNDVEKVVIQPLEATIAQMIDAAGMSCEADGWVVIGGYFGNLLKSNELDRPLYGYGNHCIDIFPAKFCPVSFAQKVTEYAYANSCGKCTYCREGNFQLSRFLKNAVSGRGDEQDIPWLHTLTETIAEESVCSFGRESVRFMCQTLEEYANEYDAHIRGKRCTADVCQAFTDYAIDGSRCIGCGKCSEVCPAGAITDPEGYIHRIDTFDCIKCGKCVDVCPRHAILKVRAGRLIGPTKLTKVGRFRSSRKDYYAEG